GLGRAAHERDVQRAGLQPGHGLDRVLAMEDQAQVRKVLGDDRSQGRQYANVRGRKRAYGQIAGLPIGRLLREALRVLDAAENVLHLTQEDPSRVRQRDVVAAAVEQPYADGSLELTDLLAQRRLRRP